jgi:hypothetical protein
MAKARVMYWKEIPVQVQAEDETGRVSKPLDGRFQEGVDAVSMLDGSSGSDEYMMGFQWGEYCEMDGSSEEAATALAERFNREFPQDFVSKIRDLHISGNRDRRPGAIDHWRSDDTG